jgi:hypothetical protein
MDWQVVFSARSKSDLQKIVGYISRGDSGFSGFGTAREEGGRCVSG